MLDILALVERGIGDLCHSIRNAVAFRRLGDGVTHQRLAVVAVEHAAYALEIGAAALYVNRGERFAAVEEVCVIAGQRLGQSDRGERGGKRAVIDIGGKFGEIYGSGRAVVVLDDGVIVHFRIAVLGLALDIVDSIPVGGSPFARCADISQDLDIGGSVERSRDHRGILRLDIEIIQTCQVSKSVFFDGGNGFGYGENLDFRHGIDTPCFNLGQTAGQRESFKIFDIVESGIGDGGNARGDGKGSAGLGDGVTHKGLAVDGVKHAAIRLEGSVIGVDKDRGKRFEGVKRG